ncbi:MAG: thioredoxin family protein [Akkermansiaceae bacterium]|nr:thioredoxin family protein [Akkermansiaceae bacterium]
MRMTLFKSGAVATILMLAAGTACASEGWTTDFEAAKRQAAAEHKDLLIDFTGSDWCAWCIKLDKEVFQKEPFAAKAAEKFVLVELDYPTDKSKQPDPVQVQNQSLLQTYPVSAYPTILLCDEEGMPYAATGYQEGGPEKYLEHLSTLQGQKAARNEAFAKAAKAEGVDKARQLIAALEAMELDDKMVESVYRSVGRQIKEADPKDETGFAAKEAVEARLQRFLRELGEKRGNLEAALKVISETLADPVVKGELRQQVHGYEAATLAYAGKKPDAIKVLENAVKEDPEGQRTKELQDFIGILQKEMDAKPKEETPAPADKKEGE